MRLRRGISLLELLAVLVIAVLLSTSLATSFSAAMQYQMRTKPIREAQLQQIAFEDRLSKLLSRAFVDDDQANANTYFVGQLDPSGSNANDAGTGATELIFTVAGGALPGSAIASQEADFETRNEQLGPVGGMTECRLALTPIGEAGNRTGLFLREQTPADEDPDQGGYESVVDDRIAAISFEFYDGTDWVSEWDTRTAERRIPAAIRISYIFDGEETTRQMVVKLRNSDVTAATPYDTSATTGGTP